LYFGIDLVNSVAGTNCQALRFIDTLNGGRISNNNASYFAGLEVGSQKMA
jgi:hypothetical protein